MTYGIFQEYFSNHSEFRGNQSSTGVVGTTANGVMYLSMPFLFAAFTRRWAQFRRHVALCGVTLASISFLLSSFSTRTWHLIVVQGILAAFGSALLYTSTTLSLGEWFSIGNRAVAYGIVLSSKNIVGTACPFLIRALLERLGFRNALRIWAGIVFATAFPSVFLISNHPSLRSPLSQRSRRIPWSFLHHSTIYIYSLAIMMQSSGYGLPQTYLSTYAQEVLRLSSTSSALLLALFNLPGIISCTFFGLLSDHKRFSISASSNTAMSAISSALCVFLLWGLTSRGEFALLVLFSMLYGFFAGGFSATWGGVIKEMEREAAERNEAIDTGLLYGLMNGARGVGYTAGGLVGVQLLQVGAVTSSSRFGYGTTYGALIVFTGIASALGGCGIAWRYRRFVGIS